MKIWTIWSSSFCLIFLIHSQLERNTLVQFLTWRELELLYKIQTVNKNNNKTSLFLVDVNIFYIEIMLVSLRSQFFFIAIGVCSLRASVY